jgi:glycosyltransferase involved in cell wall biosynthesis
MSDKPLVSILMNCFNGERYLKEAIDSVMSQTYGNWELVFWDNQSRDKSAEIFKSYDDPRMKYYYASKHTDLGGGRALAWEYLTGDYIAVLDVDDVWLPTKLEKQLPLFNDPEVGIVICDTVYFNEKKEKPLYNGKYPPTGWVFEQIISKYFVSLETLVFRKSTVSKLFRAFDPEFSAIADFDIVARLSLISKLEVYPEVLAKWRVHEASDTWKYPQYFIEEKDRWIKKLIDEQGSSFSKRYAKAIKHFSDVNTRSKVIYDLINHNRVIALKSLMKVGLSHWHTWALWFLCVLPWADKLLAHIYKRRFELTC